MENRTPKPPFIYTAGDLLLMKRDEAPMLINPVLPRVGIACLAGSSDSGKSFACVHMSIKICSDEALWLDMPINSKHQSVIYLSTEDGMEDMKRRLENLELREDFRRENLRFIFDVEQPDRKLRSELARQPADLVIIDTFGDIFSKDLNSSIEVRAFLNRFKALAREFECLILFCHHIGKGKENRPFPSKNDVLGSQGIEAACRTVLMLQKNSDGTRVLSIVKGNHLSDEIKKERLELGFTLPQGFSVLRKMRSLEEPRSDNHSQNIEVADRVKQAYADKLSHREIVEILKDQGYNLSKSAVGRMLKKQGSSGIKKSA